MKVEVVNGELPLTGNVSPEQARKIKMSVDALKAGKLTDEITDVIQSVAKELSAKYN